MLHAAMSRQQHHGRGDGGGAIGLPHVPDTVPVNSCVRCTFENTPGATQCEMCEADLGGGGGGGGGGGVDANAGLDDDTALAGLLRTSQ